MPILIAQLYWPVWLGIAHAGHSVAGMIAGVLVVVFLWSLHWRLTIGNWSFR